MAQHSKGPWRVEQGTTLIWGACNPDDTTTYGMGYPIAECRITPSHRAPGPSYEEGEANARLIAASPDLIEALEFYADPSAWNQPPIKTLAGEFGPAYENQSSKVRSDRGRIARAAIARATGAA